MGEIIARNMLSW